MLSVKSKAIRVCKLWSYRVHSKAELICSATKRVELTSHAKGIVRDIKTDPGAYGQGWYSALRDRDGRA